MCNCESSLIQSHSGLELHLTLLNLVEFFWSVCVFFNISHNPDIDPSKWLKICEKCFSGHFFCLHNVWRLSYAKSKHSCTRFHGALIIFNVKRIWFWFLSSFVVKVAPEMKPWTNTFQLNSSTNGEETCRSVWSDVQSKVNCFPSLLKGRELFDMWEEKCPQVSKLLRAGNNFRASFIREKLPEPRSEANLCFHHQLGLSSSLFW